VSALRGSHRRPHKYAFDMRCISHLEMKCVPKNTEIHRRSFVRVGRLRGMIRQIGSAQMDFIDHEALEFSPRRRCPRPAHNGVLDFVNEKLPQLRMSGDFSVFRNKACQRTSRILSATVVESRGFNSAGSVTVAEAALSAATTVGGAIIAGRRQGSRPERSGDRGHGVWPMTALVLAVAIALLPPAIDQTQGRECVWNGHHVFLCRWSSVDPPPARRPMPPTTANSVSANWVVHTPSYEISVDADGLSSCGSGSRCWKQS
jgi:hypothetical protein